MRRSLRALLLIVVALTGLGAQRHVLRVRRPTNTTGVAAGTLTLTPTFETIGITAVFTDDATALGTASVQYRVTGASTWLDGYAPPPDRRATVSDSNANTANQYQYRAAVVKLTCGTVYDVRVNNAVVGSLTGSATTLACTPPLGGADWYVNCSGSNGSGSSGSPFNTIANGVTAASAGDTVHVVGTATHCASFTIAKSGTANAWIAVIGDVRDTCVVDTAAASNAITVSGNYLQLKNLYLKQAVHNGVQISAGQHHVWIDNLYVEDISSTQTGTRANAYNDAGVQLAGSNYNVYILNATFLNPTGVANSNLGVNQETCAIYFNGSPNAIGQFVIRGNTIGSGSDAGFRDGIGNTPEDFTGHGFPDSDISDNTINGVRDDGIQTEGRDINLRIWNNVVNASTGPVCYAAQTGYVGPIYWFRNYCNATSAGAAGWKTGGLQFGILFHNTMRAPGTGWDCFGDSAGSTTTQANIFRNNVFNCTGNPIYREVSTNTDMDYDQYYRAAGGNLIRQWNWNGSTGTDYTAICCAGGSFNAGTGMEAHGASGNPLFTDTSGHIDNTSPAYNTAVNIPNFNDANSAWPATHGSPDKGSYEVP